MIATSIKFLPVCTNCRKIIEERIDCEDNIVTPRFCPHCNVPFNAIEIPTKIPFKEEFPSFYALYDRI